ISLFDVGVEARDSELVLTGEISEPKALAAVLSDLEQERITVRSEVRLLPAGELGERTWGIVSLSIANGRERPDHKAELGTQGLMGRKVRILKQRRHWLLVQTEDRYLSWMEAGTIARFTAAEAKTWENSGLLMVTNYEERVLQEAKQNAEPVSDLVMGNLV